MQDFQGKVVIVTGASSGIGEGIAIEFVKRGAKVTLCGRDGTRLQKTLEKCLQAGNGDKARCISVRGDINDSLIQDTTIQQTIKTFGRLDVLICNHGTLPDVYETLISTDKSFDMVMNTNVKSFFFLIKKSVPYLEATKGNIITLSSIAATIFIPRLFLYSMSKVAIEYMTRAFALELAARGIRVNAVKPTLVLTPMGISAMDNIKELEKAVHPLEQRTSTVEEQVDMVVFLAGDGAKFVTGQCITVDGGITLRGLGKVEDSSLVSNNVEI